MSVIFLPLAKAQSLNNGKSAAGSPYAKTEGEFSAMLIFTDKPNELFRAWDKDTEGVYANIDVEEIKQNSSLTAAIIFSNCTPDQKGLGNVSVKFIVSDPEGDIVTETRDLEVWINKRAPSKRRLQLSVNFIKIPIGYEDLPGFYTVEALVYDKNSGAKIDLERKFNVLENKQKSKFTWVKIISMPRADKNRITPRNAKGFRHMAIVSDILPHGIWEVGPDSNGKIATTNTIADLYSWPTYLMTEKCIELGGDYAQSQFVAVNKQGLFSSIRLYEKYWVGEKYNRHSYNENYAVEQVVRGAGADMRKARKAP